MAISIIDSFEYKGKKFLDARQCFETIEQMNSVLSSSLPEGFTAFCKETGKWHIFKDNFWSEFNAGGNDELLAKIQALESELTALKEQVENNDGDTGFVSEYDELTKTLTLKNNSSKAITDYDAETKTLTFQTTQSAFNTIYPIGAIYTSTNDKAPSFGKWEKAELNDITSVTVFSWKRIA